MTHRQFEVWRDWFQEEAERMGAQVNGSRSKKPRTVQEADMWAKMKWLPAVGYEGQ